MGSITELCFLCARSKNVGVEIETLTANERTKIGEFSVLNYNLKGKMPTRICQRCHKFMRELDQFQLRCETAEKMFMELMKNKDRNKIDLGEILKKYKLNDDDDGAREDLPLILNAIPSSSTPYTFKIVDTTEEHQQQEEISVVEKVSVEPVTTHSLPVARGKPKLLNPTIVPKIESKIRMDILLCDLCNHRTSTKMAMENHMKLHIRNEKLFECSTCQKKFASNRTLKNHSAIHMGVGRKLYECKDCMKMLSSKTALNTHIKWYHSAREFKCEVCSKNFATKNSLGEHLKSHESAKHHTCPICMKLFKTASSLSNHLDIHSNVEYKCDICDLQLKSRRTLKQHEKVHSSAVLHKCEKCGAEFKRTKTYKEHLITHTNIRPYKCDYCPKAFANGPNRRKHMRDIHSSELEQAERDDKREVVQLPNIEDLLQMSQMNPQ